MPADFSNTLERNGMLAIGLYLANESGLRSGFFNFFFDSCLGICYFLWFMLPLVFLVARWIVFSLVLLTSPPSVKICWRMFAEEPEQWTGNVGNRPLIFFSVSRLALRAKCRVRLAWLIKRLLCRLMKH